MARVLMVCLGNICRSPLAEGILRSKLESTEYVVDSAGTSRYHIGEHPDPRSIATAYSKGIDISKQRAREFIKEDFDRFDLIYAMDRSNYTNIIRLAKSDADRRKVKLILEELPDTEQRDVPDPYYGGDDGFEHVFTLLDSACDTIAKKLHNNQDL